MSSILVVDDSDTSRALTSGLLGPAHRVVEAASGPEALELLGSEGFDLVLLDLLMPGMSGTEVLEELKSAGNRVPVIVLTADIQDSTRDRVLGLGARGILVKPLWKGALDDAVASAARSAERPPLPRLAPHEGGALEDLVESALGEAAIELLFASDDAAKLADWIVGRSRLGNPDRESMRSGALCEVGNVVINALLGSIANAFGLSLRFSVPSFLEGGGASLVEEIARAAREAVILVRSRFALEGPGIEGDIALFFSPDSFESLSLLLGRGEGGRR